MAYFELTVTTVLAVLVLLVVVVYKWIQNRKLNYPPGPIGLPFVGYLPFLIKEGYIKVRNLSKKYGDLFCFYFGPQLVISVNEYETAKEILSHPMTLARPPNCFDFLVGNGGRSYPFPHVVDFNIYNYLRNIFILRFLEMFLFIISLTV
ncbi:cytochrome P450 2J6 [Caerostris extrusa]|uniref:Cytochrome P450 2J6 n=1 Tax=Caerostris extrusa TaxID=172846 RepID=A0AAV4R7W0_CAEEX|nr:cytochrome P450 2J6 [Caerostris extrusa]